MMNDDLQVRRLKYRRRIAKRNLDHLGVAYLSFAMAETRVETARERLETVIVQYHDQGTTVSEIATRTHQSRAAIYKILHRHNALETNTHKEDEVISDAS
jgi:hypothetical protein